MELDYEPRRLPELTSKQLQTARANDFVRYLGVLATFPDDYSGVQIALRNFVTRYPHSIHKDLFHKAAVATGTTTDATWASPLSPVNPLRDAFLELVRAQSLIGRIPGLRKVPFQSSLPLETGGGVYTWLGEGAATKATAAAFTAASLGRAKAGAMIAVTRELATLATPGGLELLKNELVRGLAYFLDTQFVDPTVAVSANVSPASITNGAGTSVSSGTSSANANTDVQTLISAFTASSPNTENLVLLMRPSNAVALARATTSQTLGLSGGTLWGIPTFTSGACGTNMILFDASRILVADDGDMEVSASESAMIEMVDNPAEPTVAATILQSCFQRNLVAFKIIKHITWGRAETAAVRYISGCAYV